MVVLVFKSNVRATDRELPLLRLALPALVGYFSAVGLAPLACAASGEVELRVADHDTHEPIAARLSLRNSKGRPVFGGNRQHVWKDHMLIEGAVVLTLAPGDYQFELESGPEYRTHRGTFQIQQGATDHHVLAMRRFIDMKARGWWSGDLQVRRAASDLPLIMQAEDLHIMAVEPPATPRRLTPGTLKPPAKPANADPQRIWSTQARSVSLPGGALGVSPLTTSDASPAMPDASAWTDWLHPDPSPIWHRDLALPVSHELPVLLAHDAVASIRVADARWGRDQLTDLTLGRQPADPRRFRPPHGPGLWTHEIYFHVLNCGFRLPPSAGSGAGINANPAGYNRVYVHCGEACDWPTWWQGLRGGKVLVTNGPMLDPRANEQLPGHVFALPDGASSLHVELALHLATRDKVDYLEIIKDGEVVSETSLDKWASENGRLPPVAFSESGWMLVRAVARTPHTFRFAMSAPWYVERAGRPRISRRSVQFFQDWLDHDARAEAPSSKLDPAIAKATAEFWRNRLEAATAD